MRALRSGIIREKHRRSPAMQIDSGLPYRKSGLCRDRYPRGFFVKEKKFETNK